MDLASFRAVLTPAGQTALQTALDMQPSEVTFLNCFTTLSRKYPPDLARAALETIILRQQAAAKFPHAGQMYFTREALEQASASIIALHRAARYQSFSHLVDLGCSLGSDTLALAKMAPTLGIDLDPLRLAIAQANLEVCGPGSDVQFLHADLTMPLPFDPQNNIGLFFDPARRSGSRRAYSVHHYQPPLAVVHNWLPSFPALGVKISPGVDLDELAAFDAEIEFISLNGELKEAVLWFGPLKRGRRQATILPGEHTMTSWDEIKPMADDRLPVDEPRAYIYEPDPAILRAGLVAPLGMQLGAAQLDPDIAYLTATEKQDTPFARCWKVDAWLPFQLKRLRQALRERNVGEVTIKKRGSPLQPEALIHQLRLAGTEQRVVFLTHLRARPIAIIAFR
jgi:hypothetical protein